MTLPSASHITRAALLALALALAARIAAMALLPLTDPTEGRYAQVAQEMAITGDWVTPRIWMNETHLPFQGKPPLYFWAAAGAMKVLGENEFAARLPSLLAALAFLCLFYRVMKRYGGAADAGLLGVMATVSCGFFVALSGSVAVDMVFSACVAGSLLAYFAFISEPRREVRRRWSLLVFLLLAAGFMTKGPVAIVLFGLPVLAWTIRWRDWSRLRDHHWFAGTLLFLLLVAPWFVLCEMRNPGFLKYFFINENLLRFVTHDYGDAYGNGHLYPRGAALLMFLAATAPWSLLGIWRLICRKAGFREECLADRQANFLFFGFAAGVLFWCLARQLLFTYVLPMVPLFAAWIVLTTRGELNRKRVLAMATMLVAAMAVVSVACVPCLRNLNTTREIVNLACRLEYDSPAREPLVFERKTPYSALFYARGWAMPHPKETIQESLLRCKGGSALVVIEARRKKELNRLTTGCWSELTSTGTWTLVRVFFNEQIGLLQKPERETSPFRGSGVALRRSAEALQ